MNLKCGLLMNFLNFIIHRILEEEFTNFKNWTFCTKKELVNFLPHRNIGFFYYNKKIRK
jgi:hypothetical protein